MKLLEAFLPLAPVTLAQFAAPAPNELFTWLGCLAFCVMIFNQAAQVWRTMRAGLKENPPPAETYQTKAICLMAHRLVDQRNEEFRDSMEVLRKETRIDIKGIHSRINDVFSAVDRLSGEMKRVGP